MPEAAIWVYDNNSIDGSDKLAEQAGTVVRYEKQQGKGNVIRCMFAGVDAECYLMVDADNTYPASAARRLTAPIFQKRADMVVDFRDRPSGSASPR